MFKFILAASFVFTSVQAMATSAQPVQCKCTQSFENFEGHITEFTAYVQCPEGSIAELECSSSFPDYKTYSVTCENKSTGKNNTNNTGVNWSNPVGFSYCELND